MMSQQPLQSRLCVLGEETLLQAYVKQNFPDKVVTLFAGEPASLAKLRLALKTDQNTGAMGSHIVLIHKSEDEATGMLEGISVACHMTVSKLQMGYWIFVNGSKVSSGSI